MTPNIQIYDTSGELVEALSRQIASLANQKDTFYLAVSGGKTPVYLFDHLATHYKDSINWQKVKIFWVDERCVAPTHEESNFLLAQKHLLEPLAIPESNIFRMHGELDAYNEAIRYERTIREVVPSVNQVPQFDLVLLGMGSDGHTASLFPDRIDLIDSDNLCTIAKHPQSGQLRVSFTMKLINHASHVAFLVTGADKATKVEEILGEKPEADMYPAAYVNPQSGNLYWYLDKAAADDWEKKNILAKATRA
ncbi:6-phosphogluconolactonase [Xanthocytophaga agilis]|uniref:6-phosphogluconolactonase n=1 Tax=Xanthocytophaga agilis TaxID=3048010 RepID=A0AAE3UJL7_9BACT|nr:6-phosphogluconolactonase [Xanthocytophaga agilis]MDJ1505368.1 6-phosphogluconolactonase [Xanthocytophaga agilis]